MKAGLEKKQKTSTVGWWYVTLSPYPSPHGALQVVRRCARHLTESINFTRTKSQRVRQNQGKPGEKIAGKLGRMVVRDTQPMPLTSRPAASRASLRSLPHLLSHFLLLKNFQTTWTDKLRGIEELRGRLKDIALAFGNTFCSDKLGAGTVSFGAGTPAATGKTQVQRLAAENA